MANRPLGLGIDLSGPEAMVARNRATSQRQLRELATRRKDVLYLSGDGKSLTTWPGDHAAVILKMTASRRWGFYGVPYTLYYFTARDIHGNLWTGTSPGPQMYARVRRIKND